MKILSLLAVILILLTIFTSSSLISADATKPEDFRCSICRDFVHRVVNKLESPRKACRRGGSKTLDGCHFMLKQERLISELFNLRAAKKNNLMTQYEIRKACVDFTSSMKMMNDYPEFENTPLCPKFEEDFPIGKKIHADAAGWDIHVAPPSMWMAPNLVRISVIDANKNGTVTKHSQKFLDQFSYNENFKYFTTNRVVHTGLFPVNLGTTTNIVLGENEITLPIFIPTPSASTPVRMILTADPCWSSIFVNCPFGVKWKVLPRLTQLLNTLAKMKETNALAAWTMLGDNGYSAVDGSVLPQLYQNLNADALALPNIAGFGNHDQAVHGVCTRGEPQGFAPKGSTLIQYQVQNTKASAADPDHAPFDWTGFNVSDAWTPAAASNFFSVGMIGNVGFIQFSGANTVDETLPYFEEACEWVQKVKPAVTLVLSHWSGQNCNAAPGMATPNAYDLIVTLPGCIENKNTIKFVQGHSHKNVVARANTGFTVGGLGMFDHPSTFGIPLLSTFENRLRIWNFHIAYANSTGDDNWNLMMDCVNAKGGLHQCTDLAELWLDQPLGGSQ